MWGRRHTDARTPAVIIGAGIAPPITRALAACIVNLCLTPQWPARAGFYSVESALWQAGDALFWVWPRDWTHALCAVRVPGGPRRVEPGSALSLCKAGRARHQPMVGRAFVPAQEGKYKGAARGTAAPGV